MSASNLESGSQEFRNFRKPHAQATIAPCKQRRASVYAVAMPKRPPKPVEISKVVFLTEEKHRAIAFDQQSHRIIFAIGEQRYAFDFFTRITQLQPHTCDQPARVVRMSKKRRYSAQAAK